MGESVNVEEEGMPALGPGLRWRVRIDSDALFVYVYLEELTTKRKWFGLGEEREVWVVLDEEYTFFRRGSQYALAKRMMKRREHIAKWGGRGVIYE